MSTIVYWLADRTGCGQYRCLLPGDALAQRGHVIIADETMTMGFIDQADVFVGQRIAKPGPSSLWQALSRDPKRTARMVYELDDDVFALADEPANPNSRTWPPLLDNVRRNLACADVVTVSTGRLAEVVGAHTSAPVHVVPNAVPDRLLDLALPVVVGPGARTLGWSGSNTHDGDWAWDSTAGQVLDWLGTSRTGMDWRLRTFGALPSTLAVALEQAPAKYGLWHMHHDGTPDIDRYYTLLSRWFDVGLAPLAPSEFNRSKSDLRLLELAALGIPWVADNAGPYAISGAARGGLRVHNDRSWAQALTAVCGDEDMRRELRMQGKVWARTRTISAVLPRWETAFGLGG